MKNTGRANHEAASEEASLDRMLGGRITLRQPRKGYRAAIDPVFLAAAVPARTGDTVLDAGCGTGAAALCLAARVDGVVVTGLELQPEMLRYAMENVAFNAMDGRVNIVQGDVKKPPHDIRDQQYNHVMANPPFMSPQAGNPPPDPVKAAAMVEDALGIGPWIAFASTILKPKGTLTLIHRADRLPDILTAMESRFGDIRLFPLWPGPGLEKPAKRVLVQARKGDGSPLSLLPGMILHQQGGDYTPEADGVLRDAEAIVL